jgi:exosortase
LILLALLPAWAAAAWLVDKARWFWQHNPELQFGWVVLMLCAYLIWDTWEKRPALRLRASFGFVLLAVAGVGLLFLTQIYQSAYGLTPASMSGLGLGYLLLVFANLLYVFGGPGWRHFGFGFAFIFIALPIPGAIYNPIVSFLQSHIATFNVEVLKLLGVPAQQVGSLIHLPNGTVGVDEACSGIRSLQSALMATLFIGYLSLRRLGLRTLLVGLGMGVAVFGNVVRSLILSLTAHRSGMKALEHLHDAAGWSILAFTVIGVSLLAWGLSVIERKADSLAKPR